MAFNPLFSITPKLTNLLTEIAVCREKILSLKVLPQREIGLIKSARLRMIHSSTAIEGNLLNLREVEAVLSGKTVANVKNDDIIEVQNYERVLKFIDTLDNNKKIDWEKLVLTIHRLTTAKLLPKKDSGHYRRGPVYIIQRPLNKIIYTAPDFKKVPQLMNDLFLWLENEVVKQLSPVIAAAITHHQFVTIHPFIDGNGRTARAWATIVLYSRGYDIKRIFALEDYYNLDRDAYYDAIKRVRQEKNLTFWLEYFAEGFLKELRQILEKMELFSLEAKTKKDPVYLNQRQRDILEFVAINRKIFRSDVVDIVSVSPKTAYRELEFLRQKGLIKRKGDGPSSHYVLAEKL
ncbi:MAG: Fic family protein [Candidatus Beckwithbacteria bacterium]